MQRRDLAAAAAAVLAVPGTVLAQRRAPEDGRDFRSLARAVPVEAPAGRIEVVEFFWYSCPHCNAFEPKLVAWSQRMPPDVVLRRVPVAFRDDFEPQQRLYYTLEALGKVEELHGKVYDAVHVQRQPTRREDQILAWAEQNGLDRARFQALYTSREIAAKARAATQLQDAYAVDGVPALGVAGRFYTDAPLAGNMDRALQVVDWLVTEVRKSPR